MLGGEDSSAVSTLETSGKTGQETTGLGKSCPGQAQLDGTKCPENVDSSDMAFGTLISQPGQITG